MPHFLMVYMLTCIAPSVDAPALRNECDEQKHASGSSARTSGPIRRVIASDIMADTLDGSSPNNTVVMYGLASMMSRKARDLIKNHFPSVARSVLPGARGYNSASLIIAIQFEFDEI